mgnify:FL=1
MRHGKRNILRLALATLALALLVGAVQELRRAGETAVFAPERLSGERLIIDAGHGGEDGGATSAAGTVEQAINLAIAQKVDQLAGLYGVPTLLLRSDENSLHDEDAKTLREQKRSDLQNRVKIVNDTEHGILLSIHQNHYSSPRYSGAQVFYGPVDGSQAWAVHTQELLRRTLDAENARQAAAISKDIYLMAHVRCPAILVECGFLSNPAEDALLCSPDYQLKIAGALLGAYLTLTPNIVDLEGNIAS